MEYVVPAGAIAAQYSLKRFGAHTRVVERRTLIDGNVQQVLRNNPRRIHWLMMNRSGADLQFQFDAQINTAASLFIAPSGGWISLNLDDDGEICTYEAFAQGLINSGSFTTYEVEAV